MWGRRKNSVLLAVTLICAWQASSVCAAEFASEFEEYEHYSSAAPEKTTMEEAYVTYRVKKGDTLYSIARAHNITPDAVIDGNQLSDGGEIRAGKLLKIPAGKKCASSKPTRRREAKTKPVSADISPCKSFVWPVSDVRKVHSDGEQGVNPLGVVITGRVGSRVVSAAPGVVEKIGRMRGFGNFVVVRHADSLITVYACIDTVSVKKGDALSRGEELGRLSGKDGSFRFMVHRSGKPENPLKYLPKRES